MVRVAARSVDFRRRASCVLVLVWLAGCTGGPERDPSPAAEARRIVSLSPALTEILFALDLGERVVGVTDYCDHPAEAARRPRVGGFVDPSVEAILALAPDLVLVSPNVGNYQAALAVRRAGVRLEVVPSETLEDTFSAIRSVAALAGAVPAGERLAGAVRARLDDVRRRVAGLPDVPVLFCLQRDPLIVAGGGTLPAELIQLAGGSNVVRAERYPRVGIESVITSAPRVILQSRMDGIAEGDEQAVRAFWSRWSTIPAVRDGRVHLVDGTTAFRAGPRVAEAAEVLARLLHPELRDEPGPRT